MNLPTDPTVLDWTFFGDPTEYQRALMQEGRQGWHRMGDLMAAIAEIQQIQRERMAHPAWNRRDDATRRFDRLQSALHILEVISFITYYETNGTPTK